MRVASLFLALCVRAVVLFQASCLTRRSNGLAFGKPLSLAVSLYDFLNSVLFTMTPDQIAMQTLKVMEIQTWITGLAIFLGPLAGVLFTLWFQSSKDKKLAKEKLFLTLMSERKHPFVSRELAGALNNIDVVFFDSPEVKALWHRYYALLSQPPGQERAHVWIELLTAMSKVVGSKHLSQVDLDKFYIPQGQMDEAEFQRKIGMQWLRVLEKTEKFIVEPKA